MTLSSSLANTDTLVTLQDIDITAELDQRHSRPADYEREDRAMAMLIAEMADNPRNMLQKLAESPCGVCIDRDQTQLMYLADRLFPALPVQPRIIEALLVPFHHHGEAIGTVWMVTHRPQRRFDREDSRKHRRLWSGR